MLFRSSFIVITLSISSVLLLPLNAHSNEVTSSFSNLKEEAAAAIDQKLPTYVFWRGAMSEGRKPYETAFARLLVELSADKFGSAHFRISDRRMTPARGHDKLKSGLELHFSSAPRHLKAFNESASHIYSDNILSNLLGYRKLIVRTEDLEKFRNLSDIEALRMYTAGQGRNWPDVDIYEHNQLNVLEVDGSPAVLPALFSMLDAKRFDYLPLGIGEIEELYHGALQKHPDLSIVDNLIIYYPFPVHIMVSRAKPDLAQRVEYALKKGRENGSIEKLFREHFQHLIDEVDLETTQVIAIPNPDLHEEQNFAPLLLKKAHVLP